MNKQLLAEIPGPGQWPVNPQADVEVSSDRIWIDGCFDFSHHGMILDQILFAEVSVISN